MLGSILEIIGCNPKHKKSAGQSVKDVNEISAQILKSNEEFVNRTIHKFLTNEIIDATADDKLLQVVFDNLSEQLPKDHRKEYDYVTTKFNSSQQAIFLCWILEGEVNNGGFNQYYTNSSDQYASLVPELLSMMKATKFAELISRANVIYETNYQKITKDQDGTLAGFSKSYEENPLSTLDTEFYNLYLEENLHQKQIDFIRMNKEDFIK